LKVSTAELILEAVQAIRDPDVVRYGLGDMDRILALSSDPLLRFQKLTLSPEDGFVLSRVDGTTNARQVVQMIPLPPERTQRSLLGLLSTGAIEFAEPRAARKAAAAPPPEKPSTPAPPPPMPPPAAPAPPSATPSAPASADPGAAERRREIVEAWEGLKARNHFEILGLTRSVGEAEVKEAYFRLAKRFHPDVHHGASLGDLRDKLEAVFIRLGEAYDVLRDPRKRADYEERIGRRRRPLFDAPAAAPGGAPPAPEPPPDPEEEARQAEESIRKAGKLVEQEKYWEAIQLLEPALRVAQGKPRLRAQLLLARSKAKNPRWTKEAEELLLAATRESPQALEGWALLASIYAGKGLKARALSTYRRVLELEPDHEEAREYVVRNAPEPPPPPEDSGGGLLGRLFRKG
jgi:tetratricopeptide (TPR) repeat protein